MNNKWLSAVSISLLSLFLLFSLFSFSSFNTSKHTPHIHNLNHIKLIAASTCQDTRYPELCSSTISTLPDLYHKSLPEIITEILNIATSEAHASEKNCTDIKNKERSLHPMDRQSLDICLELLHDIVDEFDQAISYLSSDKSSSKHVHDLNMLFSAARTNLFTCLDGFDDGEKHLRSYIEGRIEKIAEHVSNSLALLKKIKKTANNKPQKAAAVVDGENFPFYGAKIKGFPTWLKKEDRALLMAPVDKIKFDLVVAKDGSGDYKTINEALEAAPQLSSRRFVIRIKSGEYYEYVDVNSRYRNIMFVGDGIGNVRYFIIKCFIRSHIVAIRTTPSGVRGQRPRPGDRPARSGRWGSGAAPPDGDRPARSGRGGRGGSGPRRGSGATPPKPKRVQRLRCMQIH